MRLSRMLATVMGLGAFGLMAGFGALFAVWQSGKFEAFRQQLELDAWEIFRDRYPDHAASMQSLMREPLVALGAALSIATAQQSDQQLIEQGLRAPGWQAVLCRNGLIAFGGLIRAGKPPLSLILTGRSAKAARSILLEEGGVQVIEPGISGGVWEGQLLKNWSGCGEALVPSDWEQDLLPIAALGRSSASALQPIKDPSIASDQAPEGAWANHVSPLWPAATRLLAEGTPAIALLHGDNQAALLIREEVVGSVLSESPAASAEPFLLSTPDGRNTFLCLARSLGAGGQGSGNSAGQPPVPSPGQLPNQLIWGVDFRALMEQFPRKPNRAILLMEGANLTPVVLPDQVELDPIALGRLFLNPVLLNESFGKVQVGPTEWFFQQFFPLPSSNVRVLLLDAPKAPGTALSVTLAEDAAAQRDLFLFAAWAGGIMILVLGLLALWAGRWLARPIQRFAQELDHLQVSNRVGPAPHLPPFRVQEFQSLAQSCRALYHRMRERAKLQGLLDAFVAKPIAQQLAEGVVHPGGGRYQVSILFADIRGFTKATASKRPDEVIILLNSTFEAICPPIEAHGGVIDKFIGDEVMAIFGAPQPLQDHAHQALQAALEMRRRLLQFNAERASRGLPPVALGWGIASGEVTAGVVGSAVRSNFTALGSSVNRASRLCDAAQPFEILVDFSTFQSAAIGDLDTQEQQMALEGLGTERVVRIGVTRDAFDPPTLHPEKR